MLVLRNARIIPELTEEYDSDRADIVIDNGIIQEIKAPKTADAGEVLDMTDMTVINRSASALRPEGYQHLRGKRSAGCIPQHDRAEAGTG